MDNGIFVNFCSFQRPGILIFLGSKNSVLMINRPTQLSLNIPNLRALRSLKYLNFNRKLVQKLSIMFKHKNKQSVENK